MVAGAVRDSGVLSSHSHTGPPHLHQTAACARGNSPSERLNLSSGAIEVTLVPATQRLLRSLIGGAVSGTGARDLRSDLRASWGERPPLNVPFK